ncbi:ComC/BlpC family peptide pheromone/bacteriocin [Streptococcus pluranimalium]|uniref:ComC/BlpC family peptide pheromone/bacteriocin n=1 Tax=Streptococcus pluranimalium TaxID=82348 RepID=UPI0039FBBA36
MNIELFTGFEEMETETLAELTGGFGWGDALAGLFGGLAPSPTLDQLNGKKLPKPRSCSPYGTGGTPNACNF